MSFYFYRQHDAMQSGIACMAMVCKYYGRIYSFETLSNICSITNEGVSIQALKQLAEVLLCISFLVTFHFRFVCQNNIGSFSFILLLNNKKTPIRVKPVFNSLALIGYKHNAI